FDLVRGIEVLELVAPGRLRRGYRAASGDRPGPRAPPCEPDRPRPAGEGPRRLPHPAGGPPRPQNGVEPRGADLGAGRGGYAGGGTRATAGPRRAGPGTDGVCGLVQGGGGVPPGRAGRGGLEAGRTGPEPVPSRWPLERSVMGARAGRLGP